MADDRFYVKTLTLENFRCFEKAELGPFDPSFNLLVGENGAGKSSVLVALANMLRKFTEHELDFGRLPLVGAGDIRYIGSIGKDEINHRRLMYPSAIVLDLNVYGELWKEVERIDLAAVARNDELSHAPFEQYLRKLSPGPLRTETQISPLIVFYPCGRSTRTNNVSRETLRLSDVNRVAAFANWNDARTNSDLLNGWFRDQTLVMLQAGAEVVGKIGLASAKSRRQLSLVNYAIKQMLPEVLSVSYNSFEKDVVLNREFNPPIYFSDMSEGWRALVGLISDLVRRACALNAEFLGAETLAETPGLVLIDEIDLHLHPKWQRQIVPALKKVFPKIQFFATTHSPQVIGSAQPDEIVVLTPEGQKRPGPSGSFGRDSNWVLECVMGAEGRDPDVAKELKAIWDAIEKGALRKARGLIKKLRARIGDDPDIIGAESYMWRIEHTGDEAAE